MRQFLNKWLDPKTNPMPKETIIIAYIDMEKHPKPNQFEHFGKFVTVGEFCKDSFCDCLNGIFCDSYFYDSKVIIAWMPLPKSPREM